MDKEDYKLSSANVRDIDFIHMGNEHSRDDVRTRQWTIRNCYQGKPDRVIWTSPCTNESDKSDWEEWCKREDYHCGKSRWHIVPTDECRILILDTKEDLINLDKYRFKKNPNNINF